MDFPNVFCTECQAFLTPDKPTCSIQCQRAEPISLPKAGEPFWKDKVPESVNAVQVLDDMVLVSYGERKGGAGGVMAFSRTKGKQAWFFATQHCVDGGVAWFENRLFFATCGFLGQGAELYCLDRAGRLIWHQPLPAGGWTAPIADEARIFIGLDNGQVYSLDGASGQPLSQHPVVMSRGKVWLIKVDDSMLVAVSKSGEIRALSPMGLRPIWSTASPAGLEITGAPCLAGSQLFFGAAGGRLLALELNHNHRISTVAENLKGLTAAPLHSNGLLWVGSQDRILRAFDPSKKVEVWKSAELPHGITSSPVIAGGIVAVGVNQHGVVLFNEQTREMIGEVHADPRVKLIPTPALAEDVLYIGTDQGEVLAMPWHLGDYQKAAAIVKNQKKFRDAGLYYSLAARYLARNHEREALYQLAEECWDESGEPEWAARMWVGLVEEKRAAEAYIRAAKNQKGRNNPLAAEYYYKASRLYWRLDGESPEEEKCAREAAKLGQWPLIRLEKPSVPRMIQGKPGDITFRATNIGYGSAQDLYFILRGSLLEVVKCKVNSILAPEAYFDITLSIIQTKENDEIKVDLEYQGSERRTASFNAQLPIKVEAEKPRTKLKIDGTVGIGIGHILNNLKENVDYEITGSVFLDRSASGARHPAAPTDGLTCPHCGSLVSADAKMCEQCGKKLDM